MVVLNKLYPRVRDSLRSHDGRDGKTSRWEHSELTMRADVMHTKR